MMVLLDVVYNHFGPDGNYLSTYAPGFFTKATNALGRRHQLRRQAQEAGARVHHRERALLDREFHLDGLRLDAVHAIIDDSPKHVLDELAERVRAGTAEPSRASTPGE